MLQNLVSRRSKLRSPSEGFGILVPEAAIRGVKAWTTTLMFSCQYCEIFKNTYFEEHPRTAASVVLLQINRSVTLFAQVKKKEKKIEVNLILLTKKQ